MQDLSPWNTLLYDAVTAPDRSPPLRYSLSYFRSFCSLILFSLSWKHAPVNMCSTHLKYAKMTPRIAILTAWGHQSRQNKTRPLFQTMWWLSAFFSCHYILSFSVSLATYPHEMLLLILTIYTYRNSAKYCSLPLVLDKGSRASCYFTRNWRPVGRHVEPCDRQTETETDRQTETQIRQTHMLYG